MKNKTKNFCEKIKKLIKFHRLGIIKSDLNTK